MKTNTRRKRNRTSPINQLYISVTDTDYTNYAVLYKCIKFGSGIDVSKKTYAHSNRDSLEDSFSEQNPQSQQTSRDVFHQSVKNQARIKINYLTNNSLYKQYN